MGMLYTRNAEGALTPAYAVHVMTEGNGEGLSTTVREYNQMNDTVAVYLAAADAAYTDDNGGDSVIYTDNNPGGTIDPCYEDRPAGLTINSQTGTFYLQNEDSGDGWKNEVTADSYVIRNAVPNSVHQYLIKDASGKLLENGRIKPTGTVRMLHFEWDARNSRDLGGWACDGGTVAYGKLFRGAPANNKTYRTKNEAIAKALGIRRQIDFRDTDQTESFFGKSVRYEKFVLNNVEQGYQALFIGDDYENMKKAFRSIFDAVLHDEPLYFNCSLGRDRTGTIAFMILALLGVARRNIEKDYELSSFSSVLEYEDTIKPALRTSLVSLVDYFATFSGTSFRNNVVKWFVEAGFTLDELNAFRSAMIDGEPEPLTEADIEVAEPDQPTPDEPTTYTNLVRTATEAPYGDTILDGVGYRNGAYSGSGGANSYSPGEGYVSTGNIPVTVTHYNFPVVYIKGIDIVSGDGKCRFFFNRPNGTVLSMNMFAEAEFATLTTLGEQYYKLEFVTDSDGKIILTNNNLSPGDISFRLSGKGTGDNLIVTIDEPIE